jgi:hypothetical protein
VSRAKKQARGIVRRRDIKVDGKTAELFGFFVYKRQLKKKTHDIVEDKVFA